MTYYYFKDQDYQVLINGYNFGVNTPNFYSINDKHYISTVDWDLWISSKPNENYVFQVFGVAITEFVDQYFEFLTQDQYEAHKSDLTLDHAAFIDREWTLCEIVLKDMGAELQKQVSEGTINQVQGLLLQELFSKQEPLTLPTEMGGITIHVPVTEYLGQNRSLGAARLRMSLTPINEGIGFTQSLKDRFLSVIDKQTNALHA